MSVRRNALEEIDVQDLIVDTTFESEVDFNDNIANVRKNEVTARPNLDEEIIQKRGKKERKYNIVTRSIDPTILATRKSPIKRTNQSSIDIISIL